MPTNFKQFLDYVESFYLPSHPDVLYPITGLRAVTRIGFLCDTNKIVTSTKLYPFNWITFS